MARLRISNLASADLDDIRLEGEARFGPDASLRHLGGFDRIFGLLRDQPMIGQLRPELGPDVRTFSHRPHRVVYRTDGDEVLILRIVHSAQDGPTVARSIQ
ncbi:type II toxin-antitoxin system RelE/ParE family toxin [Sphingomonas radiodurans]|uniref:type II toxin-antitoxin system RelE/ParE family toxin n=1 Tax=Sphingomonas radiodurans TaxID=2890321 RepID=UPI001E3354C0|nr:type II toxin-antitoxin system RelE/ParE family toxin [Sphingomonas radiodurans]WBH17344.1 type II toxin-antitoxin system RelE/ParE family toxin [Sphingomonas radiodurans]